MTPYEQELLEKYLAYQNVIGYERDYHDFESWYQAVRYTQGPGAARTVEEASELRYKDILDAARIFNRAGRPENRLIWNMSQSTSAKANPRTELSLSTGDAPSAMSPAEYSDIPHIGARLRAENLKATRRW